MSADVMASVNWKLAPCDRPSARAVLLETDHEDLVISRCACGLLIVILPVKAPTTRVPVVLISGVTEAL